MTLVPPVYVSAWFSTTVPEPEATSPVEPLTTPLMVSVLPVVESVWALLARFKPRAMVLLPTLLKIPPPDELRATALPESVNPPALNVIEVKLVPAVRLFCVLNPVDPEKTSESPEPGATPLDQLAPLDQRLLPPAPVQVKVLEKTVIEAEAPVTLGLVVSVAVTVWLPTVTSVTPDVKVWVPSSVGVKV